MRSFDSYQGDPIQIDYIINCSEKFSPCFPSPIWHVHHPIDALLVAGLNDVLGGSTV